MALPRFKQKRRHGTTIYGRIGGNTEGRKGERITLSGSPAIKKSATEQHGDQHGYTKGYICEEESNHVGQNNTTRKKYLNFGS